jgi:DNA-binding CsgD family transcriptional regulator
MPRVICSMLALAQGRDADAARNYNDLPPPDTWQLMPPTFLISRTHRATIAAGLGRVEEAGRLYRELLPFADHFSTSGAGTIVCFGSIELYLGMLARTIGRLDGAVQHLEKALNKHIGSGLRPFAAETRYQLALALHQRDRAGDVGRALALLTECEADAERFGLQPLLRRVAELREALRAATRRGQVMTPREMEIARFVAEGLTSREIAEALHISARTADNHVQHILDKLGLRSRSQIAAWVARRSS